MREIISKIQFGRLYERGCFGNKLRTWPTLEAFQASDFAGTVSMRYNGATGAGLAAYEVPAPAVLDVARQWARQGASIDRIHLNESAPDSALILQGEVQRLPRLYLRYSTTPGLKMRAAMREAIDADGLKADLLLRSRLTPSSYEDLQALLERYPTAVIEFSAYSRPLGMCPGRNAVIWEVRNY